MGEGSLTRREREIAALVARGKTNGEIAEVLGIGESTVKWHVSQMLHKLGLAGRVELAIYAERQGLQSPP